jgi:hypothetical protein
MKERLKRPKTSSDNSLKRDVPRIATAGKKENEREEWREGSHNQMKPS